MGSDKKVRTIGARKGADPISISTLLTFAEKVIQTDKDAVLKAQSAITDLTARSSDTGLPPKISALSELCGKSGSVKLQSTTQDSDSNKLVDLNSLRRKS
jgi:hypothetical protein